MIDISDLTAVQLHCPGIADFDPMPSILRRKTHAIVVNNESDDEIIDVRWPHWSHTWTVVPRINCALHNI